MSTIRIKKGRDIKLKGTAEKAVEALSLPAAIAIQPQDFRGLRARLLVKVGDSVNIGTPLFQDKTHADIKVVSPASGKVVAINRGEKRVLLEIIVELDKKQQKEKTNLFSEDEIKKLSREKIIKHLCEGGVWPCIRQRPFSNVADPEANPKAIFIQAMNTEPLAPDVDFILQKKEKMFQAGLNVLTALTSGGVHVCCHQNASSAALTQASNVKIHRFSGPHPAGNVSTHIHNIDPIHKGETVWYLKAEDVLKVASLFLEGAFLSEKIVAVTGEGAAKRNYKKTVLGVPLQHLLGTTGSDGQRYLSGSVLNGTNVGKDGFLCFYDSQITVFSEGGDREFLGWLKPGFNKYTFSNTFASAMKKQDEVALDADLHGGLRAIVLNDVYDKYVALDILTYFLLKAVISGDIEEAEHLGILECDEEDFALCAFACPSKIDVGGIIRQGLDSIEAEG